VRPPPPGASWRSAIPSPDRDHEWRIRLGDFFSFAHRTIYGHPPGRALRRAVTRDPDFTPVEVNLRRGHPDLDGFTIAFLSDLHVGGLLEEHDLDRIIATVAERAPDLVVLGGDLMDHWPDEIEAYRRPLSRLDPPEGIVAVPGNHEYHREDDLAVWRSTLKACGVEVLINRGREIRRGAARLWVAGVDDLSRGRTDLDASLNGRRDADPVLLLTHEPDVFHEAFRRGIDLTLAGHTHGGQINVAGWSPIRHSKFGWWRGRYERDGSVLYVGRGVGFSMLPIRIGSPAEIPLVTLRRSP
jgi:predicted MPP superfamily phosphohydrolase